MLDMPIRSERSFDALDSRVLGLAALTLAALATGVAGAVVADSQPVEGPWGVILGVLLVIGTGVPLLLRLRANRLDGPGLYALITVAFLGVTSLGWLGDPKDAGPGLDQADVASALVFVAAGLVMFTIGARLVAGPVRRPPLLAFPARLAPSRLALIVAFLVALLGTLLGLATHTYGYLAAEGSASAFGGLTQAITFLAAFGGLVVLATALTYFGASERGLLWPLVCFVGIETAIGFFIGVKGAALQPLLFVALAFLRSRGKVPWLRIGVVAVLTLTLLVPINDVYRKSLRNDNETPRQALTGAVSGHTAVSSTHSVKAAYDYIFTRFRLVDSVALITRRTPRTFPYADGSRYWSLPALIVVPRVLWPEKPAIDDAAKFSHTYYEIPSDINTSTPITQGGDLFRNFGLVGLLGGLLAWGMVIGGWQRAYERRRSPRWEMVYLYTLVYFVTYVESDLPNLIATAAKTLPLVALAAWLLLPGRDSPPGYHRLLRPDP
jgi:hypothetical protein